MRGSGKMPPQATVLPWRMGPLTPLDRVYQERGYLPALAKGETRDLPGRHPGAAAGRLCNPRKQL